MSIKELTDKLEALFDAIGSGEELMLISTRQIDAVERTKEAIAEAKEPLLYHFLQP